MEVRYTVRQMSLEYRGALAGYVCLGVISMSQVVNAMGLGKIIWEVSVDREEVLGLNCECYRLKRQGGINKKD